MALLCRAVSRDGVEAHMDDLPLELFTPPWTSPEKPADIIHLHWLNPYYWSRYMTVSWAKSRILVRTLRRHRQHGTPLVWTVHNVVPHEMPWPKIDLWVREKVQEMVDAHIFHSAGAKEKFQERFGTVKRAKIIPHGEYPVSRVPQPPRDEARNYFDLPAGDTLLALQFGQARSYKGYERVIAALPHLAKNDIHVLLAGEDYPTDICRDNASVLPRYIAEYELPALFAAADVLLLPYTHCTTSGQAVMAIGFSVPLVCSDVGPLPDLCDRGLGVLCDPDDATDLARATQEAAALQESSGYATARREYLQTHGWDEIGRQTVALYEQIAGAATNM
jgi:glycosyltransferase involved in cell wall biosynthesis